MIDDTCDGVCERSLYSKPPVSPTAEHRLLRKVLSSDKSAVNTWRAAASELCPFEFEWGDSCVGVGRLLLGRRSEGDFSVQKNCEEYSLTHHSSFLKASIGLARQ